MKEHVTSASQAKEYMVDPSHESWTWFRLSGLGSSFVFDHSYMMYLREYSGLLARTRSANVSKVICKDDIHLHLQCILFECHAFRCQSRAYVL